MSRRQQSSPKRWDINHSSSAPRLVSSHQESFFFLRAPRQAIDFPCPDQYLAVTVHDPYQHYKNQCRCSDVYLFVHSARVELSYMQTLMLQFCILSWCFMSLLLYFKLVVVSFNYWLDWWFVFLERNKIQNLSFSIIFLVINFILWRNIITGWQHPSGGPGNVFFLKNHAPPSYRAPYWGSEIIVTTRHSFCKG